MSVYVVCVHEYLCHSFPGTHWVRPVVSRSLWTMQCGPTSLTTQQTEELTLRPLAQRYGDRQVILIYSMTCDWILVCSMSQMLVFLLIAICKTLARENEKHYSANPWHSNIWIENIFACMYCVNTMARKLSFIEPTPKVRALFQHILHW